MPVPVRPLHCCSLCRPFQIDVGEDDIDDGFRRLFAQLAGEVGVPHPAYVSTPGDEREKMVFVLRAASGDTGRRRALVWHRRVLACSWSPPTLERG